VNFLTGKACFKHKLLYHESVLFTRTSLPWKHAFNMNLLSMKACF